MMYITPMSNTITNPRLPLIADLANAICMVTFTKMDGTTVKRWVTLNTSSAIPLPDERIRQTLRAEVEGADLQNPQASILAWDTVNMRIISFAVDRMVDFRPMLDIESA